MILEAEHVTEEAQKLQTLADKFEVESKKEELTKNQTATQKRRRFEDWRDAKEIGCSVEELSH